MFLRLRGNKELNLNVKIIALSNQKGGVGKTTTAMNLSTALAACGKRVLVIDLDPQGNTTTGFGFDKTDEKLAGHNAYTMLMEESTFTDAVVATRVPKLDIVPSTVHLAGAELELVTAMGRESRLKNALLSKETGIAQSAHGGYDYVFIDCPPSLGLLTLNAFMTSDEVLIPVQCEFFALEGLSQLFQTIEMVKKSINPKLTLMGVLLTMYDRRNQLAAQVRKELVRNLGDKVLQTIIPRNIRLAEAPSHGMPGLIYDVQSEGSRAYIRLAAEILKKDGQK